MMRKLLLLVLLLILPRIVYGQGIPFAVNPPAPNATMNVCSAPAVGSNPCTNTVTVYSNATLTTSISQPIQIGPTGNYTFFFNSTNSPIVVQITGRADQIVGGGGGQAFGTPPATPNGVTFTACEVPSGGVAGTLGYCWPGITVTSQTGASYTYGSSNPDRGTCVKRSNAAAMTDTIPDVGAANWQFSPNLCVIVGGTTTDTVSRTSASTFVFNGQTLLTSVVLQPGITYDFNSDPNSNWVVSVRGPVGCVSACSWYPYWVAPPTAVSNFNYSTAAGNNLIVARFTQNNINLITRIGYYIQTGAVSSTGDVGVFGPCGATTCSLLWHTGGQSTASTGAASVVITPVLMGPGTYYLATCDTSTTPQIEGGALTSVQPSMLIQGLSNVFGSDITDVCAAGFLPSTMTIANVSNSASVTSVPFLVISN